MRALSLSSRLVLLTSLGLLLVSLIGLGAQLHSHLDTSRRSAEDASRSIGAALFPLLQQTLVAGDIETAEQAISQVVKFRSVDRITLLNPDTGMPLIQVTASLITTVFFI